MRDELIETGVLREAVSNLVRGGDEVALEGFTHLIPSAVANEIIRQKKHDLTLVRMTLNMSAWKVR